MPKTKSKTREGASLVIQAAFRADEALPVVAEIALSEAFMARVRELNAALLRMKAWSLRDAVKRMGVHWRYEEVSGRDSSLSILTVTQNAFTIESDYTRGPLTASVPLSALFALVEGKSVPRGVCKQSEDKLFYAETREKLRRLMSTYKRLQTAATKR